MNRIPRELKFAWWMVGVFWVFIVFLFMVSGCSIKGDGYEAVIDTAVLEEHTKQVVAKTEAAAAFAAACKTETIDPNICAEDAGCIMGVVMANAMAANSQADCVKEVAGDAAAVAIEVPAIRARGWASFNENFFGKFLNNNAGVIAGAWLGSEAFSFGKAGLASMERTAVSAGRANIDNSTVNTTTTTTSEANGNTSTTVGDGSIVGSGQIGDNTSTVVDNGSQIGDGIIAGGSVAGGSQCSGELCQPTNIQNPVTNNEPEPPLPPNPAPVPGDADGVCFTFSLVSDPDCVP